MFRALRRIDRLPARADWPAPALPRLRRGIAIAAIMPIITITTTSSTSEKARVRQGNKDFMTRFSTVAGSQSPAVMPPGRAATCRLRERPAQSAGFIDPAAGGLELNLLR